jgi:hypothetical protein
MIQSSRYADIKEDGSRYIDLEDFEQGFDREHIEEMQVDEKDALIADI